MLMQIQSAGAQIGGTLISQDPTFLAINTARILGPLGLRRVLLDPEGQNHIIRLARTMFQPKRFQKEIVASLEGLRQFADQEETNGN